MRGSEIDKQIFAFLSFHGVILTVQRACRLQSFVCNRHITGGLRPWRSQTTLLVLQSSGMTTMEATVWCLQHLEGWSAADASAVLAPLQLLVSQQVQTLVEMTLALAMHV